MAKIVLSIKKKSTLMRTQTKWQMGLPRAALLAFGLSRKSSIL